MDLLNENAEKSAEIPEKVAENSAPFALKQRTLLAKSVQTWAFSDSLIRTIQIEDASYFVGKDVATALEYKKASDLTRYLDTDEVVNCTVPTSGGAQEMLVVNEPGLYHAIFLSRSEAAKEFRRWVTNEVLPAIRKNGSYSLSLDSELEQERKRMEIAKLRANRYVLEHLEELQQSGTLSPKMLEHLINTPSQKADNTRLTIIQKLTEWAPRLVPAKNEIVRLSDCLADFCNFSGEQITQTFFTRNLKRINKDIVIAQQKLDRGKFPVQIILNHKLME